MLKVVQEDIESNVDAATGGGSLLDQIVRDGARQMLAAALQAEVAAYIAAHAEEVDEHGHRLVVRNGYHQPREVSTAAGAVPVRQPRVNDRRIDEASGQRKRFTSAILPAWARKSPQQDEAKTFSQRSLAETDYVYVWVDGIHLKVRLNQDKVCLLVMVGVRADGTKELVALEDGHRESTESWADLLRSCKRRGMRAPVLAVGDGALGFWRALRDVFPATAEQRCWWHKIGNVLAALPKSVHKDAKAALAEIYNAQDREHALAAAKAFSTAYGAKWPKATAKVTDDLDVLLAFYDFPAEHWIHLRTTNPIESTFATVRLRQRVTKGPGSRAAGIAMAFKLIESAQRRWRAVNAPHLVALVRAGATFEKGKLVERPEESGGQQHVA